MDYIAQDSPRAAIELDEAFQDEAKAAAQPPKLYRTGRVPGTREIVVKSNDIMVYRIEREAIVVLRVLHAAQQWPPADEKL